MCLSEEQWGEVIRSTHGQYIRQPDRGDGVARYTVLPPKKEEPKPQKKSSKHR